MKIFSDEVTNKVNEVKENVTEQREEVKKQPKVKRLILAIIAGVVVFVIGICLLSDSDSDMSSVKNGRLYDYPDKTVSEAFDDAFAGTGEWYEYDNGIVVYKTVFNTHIINIKFNVYEDKSFDITSLKIDNIDYTWDLNSFLYAVYEQPEILRVYY